MRTLSFVDHDSLLDYLQDQGPYGQYQVLLLPSDGISDEEWVLTIPNINNTVEEEDEDEDGSSIDGTEGGDADS